VHAVARHRHDLLVGLNRLDQPQLVFRACAGEYVDVADSLLERGGVQLLNLRACYPGLPVADAEHFGDRGRGDLRQSDKHH